MSALYLTLAGLAVAALAAAYSVITDNAKTVTAKGVLTLLALVGLGAGIAGARHQDQERKDADDRAIAMKKKLDIINDKVGDVAGLDDKIQKKQVELTALDALGDARYYVTIDTFLHGSAANDNDFTSTKNNLLALFPDAENNGLLWTQDVSKNQYELRLGRNLTLSSAEIYRQLAQEGSLASGKALIRREH